MRDTNQVPHSGPTIVSRHRTKFSRPGHLARCIYVPLVSESWSSVWRHLALPHCSLLDTKQVRDILHQPVWELEQIRGVLLALLRFALLFPHGELGWHLAVQYQSDTRSHNNNTVSCRNFAAYRLWIKSSRYSLLHCATRLFLYSGFTLITEMCVPSLPMSPGTSKLVLSLFPVYYSHKYSSNKPHEKMFLFTVRVIQ